MKQLKKFVGRIPLAGHALEDSQDGQSRKDVAAYWTSLSLWKISPGFERSRWPVWQEALVAFSRLHSQKGKHCGAHPEKYGKIYMPLTDCGSTIGKMDLRPARRFCRPSGRRSLLILKRERQEFYKNFLKTAEKLHLCVQLLAGNGV